MANRKRNPLLEQLKQATAMEMGIELGADQTSRNNGKVGGQMVKKLIQLGEIKLSEIAEQQAQQQQIQQNKNKEVIEMPNYMIEDTQNQNLLH